MVKTKKVLSLLLAVVIGLTLLPVPAGAADVNEDGVPDEASISTVLGMPLEGIEAESVSDSVYEISAGVTVYSVEDSVSKEDISAYDITSEITFYGTDDSFSAEETGPVDLNAGENTVYVKVVSAQAEPEITAYYTLSIYRLDEPTVDSVTVYAYPPLVLKGTTKQLTAAVAGSNNPSQEVTWSIVEEVAGGTSIREDGLLTVAADETATTLTIKATSVVDTNKFGTAAVTVVVPTYTGVTVSPAESFVTRGTMRQLQFAAEVVGSNSPSQEVTWSVDGKESSGTVISDGGLLTVAAEETAAALTVTATSVGDSSKSGTAAVTIVEPLEEGVYSIPLNFTSGNYAINKKQLFTNGTAVTQFDKRALVHVVDGGYEVTLLYHSQSIYDLIQIVDPEKLGEVKALLKDPANGYNEQLNNFPFGDFNWPEEKLGQPRTTSPEETNFISPDFNRYYLQDVEITQANAAIDTGYVTFRVPNLTDEVLIKTYSRVLSVSNNSQGSRLTAIIMYFDPSLAMDLPGALTLEEGNHRLGYAWTNQVKTSATTASQAGRMDISGSNNASIDILQDEVSVTADESGRLTATFTLETDDPVVSVEKVVSRNLDLNAAASTVKFYWVDAHGYSTYEPLDISNGTFTLPYENLAFGIPLRVKTQSTGSQYYYGSLRLDLVPVTDEVKSDNGVTLYYRSNTLSDGSVFAAPSYTEYENLRTTYISRDRFDAYTAYATIDGGAPHYRFYSVSLTYNNAPVTPQEMVTLSFPIPAEWDINRVGLFFFGNLTTNNPNYSVDYENRTISIITQNVNQINSDYLLFERGLPDDLSAVAAEDGLYRAKVFVRNANKDDVSMSAFTVAGNNGYIEVKNGQKTLYYEAQPTAVGGIPGWMRRAFYYDGSAMNGDADYLSYHAKADGSLQADDVSEYYYNHGGPLIIYPKRLAVPLLGTVSGGYYKVGFNIPIMESLGGSTDYGDGSHITAEALLMLHGVEKIEGANPLLGYDKTIIRAQLDKAALLPAEIRTALASAVSAAQAVYGNSAATSEEIKAAADTLAAAIAAVQSPAAPVIGSTYDQQNNSYTVTITSPDGGVVKYRLSGSESGTDEWLDYTEPFAVDSTNALINQGVLYVSAYVVSSEPDKDDSQVSTILLDFRGTNGPGTIQNGEYTLPVNMWHSVNSEPSMGNNALEHTATLRVENGQGTLQLTFKPLTFMNMTGYLSQLDLLDHVVLNENNYPVGYDLIPATVLSTYDVVDDFNKPDSNDPNCAGKPYPHEITVPVTLNQEYTWIHVYVPVMGSMGFGDQVARIKLDWSGLTPLGEPNPDANPARQIGDSDGDGVADLTQDTLSGLSGTDNVGLSAGGANMNIPAQYLTRMFAGNPGATLRFQANESPSDTQNAVFQVLGDNGELAGAFDLNLTIGAQSVTELGGRVRITLTLTDAQVAALQNADSKKLFYFNPNTNTLTDMSATFDLTAKTATFYTTHLSTYALVSTTSTSPNDPDGPGAPGGTPPGNPGNSHGIADGTYSIRVKALQEYSNDRSMADQFFVEPAELSVSGEMIAVTVYMYGSSSSPELAGGIHMDMIREIMYRKSGSWVNAKAGLNTANDKLKLSMTVNSLDDIYMRVYVPEGMGESRPIFRLVFDRNSIRQGSVNFGSGITPSADVGDYTIEAAAGTGGTITPSGSVGVKKNESRTFTIAASAGYIIKDVLVDGKSVGAVGTYTFEKVTGDHTISASFEKTASAPAFTDTATHWAKGAIDFIVAKGLFTGTSDTAFSPDDAMTRGMFVTILGRMHGVDTSKYKTVSFTDVDAAQYYAPYVAWAVESKITNGMGGDRFAPDNTVTREQAATMFANYRAFAEIDGDIEKTPDSLEDGRYTIAAKALMEAKDERSMADQFLTEKTVLTVENGRIKASMTWHGTEYITMDMIKELKYQRPDGSFAEVGRVLSADNKSVVLSFDVTDIRKAVIFQVYVPAGMGESRPKFRLVLDPDTLTRMAAGFADDAKISSWAKDGVLAMQLAGLFRGDANGNFNPQNPITRAEAATIFARSLGFTG